MKHFKPLLAALCLIAPSPALAFQITDKDTGNTISVDHSDYGMSLSDNALGKIVGNKHVYGFVAFDYAHNDRANLNATSQEPAASPQSDNGMMSMIGISYRF